MIGLARLAGGEGQRAARSLVVAAGGGAACDRRPVHRHRRVVGGRKGDGKSEWRLAGVALAAAHGGGNRDARLVVEDGTLARGILDDRIRRIAEDDHEVLGRLADPVAVDQHAEGRAGCAGRESQRSGEGLVIAPGGGTARGRGEVHGDGLVAHFRQRNGEGDQRGAGVAFRHRLRIRDADRGRARRNGRQKVGTGLAPAVVAIDHDGPAVVDGRGVLQGRVGAGQQLVLQVHHAVRGVPEERMEIVVVGSAALLVIPHVIAGADDLAGVVDGRGVGLVGTGEHAQVDETAAGAVRRIGRPQEGGSDLLPAIPLDAGDLADVIDGRRIVALTGAQEGHAARGIPKEGAVGPPPVRGS